MDLSRESMEFLAHFDGSKSVHFDHEPQGLFLQDEFPDSLQLAAATPTIRNAAWVLRWFAALATLVVAASLLIDFGYRLSAEHALLRAARAGAFEATLPRATRATVESTIARRLVDYPALESQLRLGLHRNGDPVRDELQLQQGDRLLVTLAVPRDAASPQWIDRLNFWRSNTPLQAEAERVVPGRRLARQS